MKDFIFTPRGSGAVSWADNHQGNEDMASMNATSSDIRASLLGAAVSFVRAATRLPNVLRISLVGSIVTTKPSPKDIDLLVIVTDEADLRPLAALARKLQGRLQSLSSGAGVFLADASGKYLGRTCHWKDCRPGIRASCDVLHRGRRPYLHDDLKTVTLQGSLVLAPPVDLWPHVVRRAELPADVEAIVGAFEKSSNDPMHRVAGVGRGADLLRTLARRGSS